MRSSKHNNKKGILGGHRKGGASRRTSEINEDFLAEFRELEKQQEEINRQYYGDQDMKMRSRSSNSSSGAKRAASRSANSVSRRRDGRSQSRETMVTREPVKRTGSQSNYETKVFSKAELENASRRLNNNRVSNNDMNFQKKNFDSESFERNAMRNSYGAQGQDARAYENTDYLGGTKTKKKVKKQPKGKKKKPKTTTGKKVRKVLIILLLLIAVCGVGIYYYIDVQLSKLGHVETDVSEFEIDDQVKKDLKDYRNIAVMGIDAREGEDKSTTRTDAIIVASLNKKTGNVSLISVMRDSYLEMDSSTGTPMFDKITHAHVYGGPVNTCKSLNKALDLNISEFVVMDWKAVADTVDAIGGITVDVKDYEIYDLNHWGPETAANTGRTWNDIYNTGNQKIDGAQAATYCRIRKNSGGDTGRTERMRKVIMAILKEVKKHPSKITKVADKVLPEVTTNMGTFDITSLLPQVVNFDISNSIGYPYNYYGGSVEGSWKAVPTTLSYNAIKLHKEAFNQKDYTPTARLEEMSENIIYNTGISEGYEE